VAGKLAQAYDEGVADLQVERERQAAGFVQPRLRAARSAAGLSVWVDDEGALNRRLAINEG